MALSASEARGRPAKQRGVGWHGAWQVVGPKKALLAESEAQLDVVMTALRSKQAELQKARTGASLSQTRRLAPWPPFNDLHPDPL